MPMFPSPLCLDGEGVTVTIDRFAPLKEGRVAQEDVLPGQVLIECTVSSLSLQKMCRVLLFVLLIKM